MATNHSKYLNDRPETTTPPTLILPNRGTAEIKNSPAATPQVIASSCSCLSIDLGTRRFSWSASASVNTAMMSIMAPTSKPKNEDAAS